MAARKMMGTIRGRMWKEGNWWFSEADKLPVAGFGKTPQDAMNRVSAALCAYLEACHKDNELDIVFQHYGLVEEQKTPDYAFCFETPLGERRVDLVPA